MWNWKFLLLGFFSVPRRQCSILSVNKTGLLFDQLDHLLVQTTYKHFAMYDSYRDCSNSLDFLEEQYHSDKYGIVLLQNILERYNYLTRLYNSGCEKQKDEGWSEEDPTCGPFGCHRVGISSLPVQPRQKGSNARLRSDITFITIMNGQDNQLTIFTSTTPQPTTEPTTQDPCNCHYCCEPPAGKDRKWLPLPFHPWGYWSKIQPVSAPPHQGIRKPRFNHSKFG